MSVQAVAAGSASMAALFAARMADIFCKQGDVPAAEQAAAAAEQQLDTVPESGSLALAYCTAAVQLVRAQLGLAAAGGSPGKAVWQACQTAVAGCEVLVSSAASDAAGAGSFCSALHAAALLTLAEAAIRRDDVAGARRHAAAALAAAETGGTCSAARCQHASALLFLGRHAATGAAAQQHLSIWGLGATGCGSSASCDAEAAAASKSRARKQPAGRGRSKAAAAAAEDVDGCNASAAQQDRMRQLWQALECSRGLLPAHRHDGWRQAACRVSCMPEGQAQQLGVRTERRGEGHLILVFAAHSVHNCHPLCLQGGRCPAGSRVRPAWLSAPRSSAAALLAGCSASPAVPAGAVQPAAAAGAAAASRRER